MPRPDDPRWTYAVSKLAGEHLGYAYHRSTAHSLPVTIVRPFNVYGPRQIAGAIPAFVRAALVDEPIIVYGDGSHLRSWCFIDDVVTATLRCMARPDVVGKSFNVGNRRTLFRVDQLARTIRRLAESASDIVHVSRDVADIDVRLPEIALAKTELNWEPRVDLDEGLLRTIDWFRAV